MRCFRRAVFVIVTMILMFFIAYNRIPVAAAQSAQQKEDAANRAKEAAAAAKAAREKADIERKEKEAAAELARQQADAAAELARQQADAAAKAAADLIWKSFDADMVLVQGGTFTMGCTAEQKGDCAMDETPTQDVTLHDFYIGKYEVTQAQWRVVMGNNPSGFEGDNLPVERVSWNDVQEFINRLNEVTDGNYRLPTEAEWEYAARGGNQSRGYKYSGSNDIEEVAWYENNSSSMTHPVDKKNPNELGVHDMSGNVYEWVHDWFGNYSEDQLTNPQGHYFGTDHRVIRGGSYSTTGRSARVSVRHNSDPDDRYRNLGFRLARRSKEAEAAAELARIEAEAAAGHTRIAAAADAAAQDARIEAEAAEEARKKAEAAAELARKKVEDSLSLNMVLVQGGTFTMGCTPEQGKDCDKDEKPTHQVTLSDFYIGKYEVTVAQWHKVMGDNSSSSESDNWPVVNVSWSRVQEFTKKLNEMTGENYRLPTEAEWEYAARGGSQSQGYKHSGSDNIRDVGWYNGSWGRLHPVGEKNANELGIHDMSGNVSEWVNDWYGDYNSSPQTNPQGPSSGSKRVVRGGDGSSRASNTRVSSRNSLEPGSKQVGRMSTDGNLGFRLARSSE